MQRVDRGGHVRPETGAGSGREASAFADGGDVLAGEAADQDVHGFDLRPADSRDVAQVWSVGPVEREDSGDGLVDLGEPDCLGVEDVFDGEVESAVARKE